MDTFVPHNVYKYFYLSLLSEEHIYLKSAVDINLYTARNNFILCEIVYFQAVFTNIALLFFSWESTNIVPHYHKLYIWISHISGILRGQHSRIAMDKPSPWKTTFCDHGISHTRNTVLSSWVQMQRQPDSTPCWICSYYLSILAHGAQTERFLFLKVERVLPHLVFVRESGHMNTLIQ